MIIHHVPHLLEKKIILASQSPRRVEILQGMGLTKFQQVKSGFAEDLRKQDYPTAAGYCLATAEQKALDVAQRLPDADLVIAADTIVVLDGAILEKPGSEADAVRMLKALSGKHHVVVSAVCLVIPNKTPAATPESAKRRLFHSETDVWFDELCDDIVQAYVKSGEPMDKAGGYGIQGMGASFVREIKGCYFTVMGLPANALAREIRKLVDDDIL